ncbi:MAG TPA: hypothetical protein VK834_00265 [Bradyrhizobium sp.]|nr:hypothetical protein [Bradyrhizobium sp.]
MIQSFLIGSPKTGPHPPGGIGPFVQSVLLYSSLLLRLAVAAIVWRAFAWLGWTVPAGLGFLALEIYASLLVLRIFADLLAYRQLGLVLKAMWLPNSVIAIAVYLLFFNDQGRELGFGLMDLNEKGVYLGIALVYWALNNWLSARVGLAKNFPTPENDQFLLFWAPRILGVCAHLLAACSLAVAAWKQPDLQGVQGRWLVVAAPVAIVLATIFAWLLDKGYVSERYPAGERPSARKLMYGVGAVELLLLGGLLFAVSNKEQAGLSLAALCITGSALFFLVLISVLRRKAPLDSNASDEVRTQDQANEWRLTVGLTLGLVLTMLVAATAIWIWPMRVGQIFGSLTIACFSFGAILAVINFFELLATQLTKHALQAEFDVQRSTVWAVLICFLVVPAFLASLSHPFHRVRLCEGSECTPIAAAKWAAIEKPDKRPSVSEAALAWYAQVEPVYHAVHPNEPVPMLIVATAGGGIRAAYWTATILERLETLRWSAAAGAPSDDTATEAPLRNLLFAISGVSGGSVGAAAYAAAVHDHEVTGAGISPTKYLQSDFLAPGLASMVFIDGPANLLPDFGQIDRGQALELGFEAASRTPADDHGLVSHRFLSFFPTMAEVTRMKSWRPALLLNATHQETGRRIITSHIKIERGVVFDSYDALQVLNSDLRLSTAAHNSARFTYISPAGNLSSATKTEHNRGYVIDGGYFENYGAETALELANKAIKAINDAVGPEHLKHQSKVKLVILQISSDPTLQSDRTLVRVDTQGNDCVVSSFEPEKVKSDPADPANYLEFKDAVFGNKNEGEGYVLPSANELSAPLVGIMSVREAHGTIAAEELASSVCEGKRNVQQAAQNQLPVNVAEVTGSTKIESPPHFAHLAMCQVSTKGTPGITPPLGWVLSDQTRDRFKDILDDCGNPDQLKELASALGLQLRP